MKKIHIISYLFLLLGGLVVLPGCKKLFGLERQTDYDYQPLTADPHINISAKEFLINRANGSTASPNDTVFRWMKKGLDYAGIDLAEYEKKGRTFIFLHNDAIKVWNNTTKKVTAGFFFTFQIVDKDPSGNPMVDPVTGVIKTHTALEWSDYSQQTVKNYFLYLIGEGEFNFTDLNDKNKTVPSLLPAGTKASTESILGYVRPPLDTTGRGFDTEGKFNLKILNGSDQAPIVFNDKTSDRSAGYIATNGIIHVYGGTVWPFR